MKNPYISSSPAENRPIAIKISKLREGSNPLSPLLCPCMFNSHWKWWNIRRHDDWWVRPKSFSNKSRQADLSESLQADDTASLEALQSDDDLSCHVEALSDSGAEASSDGGGCIGDDDAESDPDYNERASDGELYGSRRQRSRPKPTAVATGSVGSTRQPSQVLYALYPLDVHLIIFNWICFKFINL